MTDESSAWRRCSTCKKDIAFEQVYWVCSVSTCNRKRTGMVFCDVSCWEPHVPVLRHREAWAEERRAPTRAAWRKQQAESSGGTPGERATKRTLVRPTAEKKAPARSAEAPPVAAPHDILIVASKLKAYIRAVSGMNTSDPVMERLSDHVRALCHDAIREARRSERKTVMERDFPDP